MTMYFNPLNLKLLQLYSITAYYLILHHVSEAMSIQPKMGLTQSGVSPNIKLDEIDSEINKGRRQIIIGTVSFMGQLCLSSASQATEIDGNTFQGEGIPAVVDSSIGKVFRLKTVEGARVIDRIDEKWERFSDSLRDKNLCDEETGRRLFDNGFRKDGSRIGNPVLGSLCNPQALEPLDEIGLVADVLQLAKVSAMKSSQLSETNINNKEKSIQELVYPSFRLADDSIGVEERKRRKFNFDMYCLMRSLADLGVTGRTLEPLWGQALMAKLESNNLPNNMIAKSSVRIGEGLTKNDVSDNLLQALNKLSVSFYKLQQGGLVGKTEINVPTNDYGSVVTIAIDDDITIGGQILLREQRKSINGSFAMAMVKAAMDEADISYTVDSFFLDPSTTKQSVFEPTQLLLNLSNIQQR